MYLADITLALFTFFNVLRFGSYVPQIARVAMDQDGARAISYATWCVWIGANLSTAAYTVVNIADWGLFAVSILNAAGCGAVVLLTVWKRRQLAERQMNDTSLAQKQSALGSKIMKDHHKAIARWRTTRGMPRGAASPTFRSWVLCGALADVWRAELPFPAKRIERGVSNTLFAHLFWCRPQSGWSRSRRRALALRQLDLFGLRLSARWDGGSHVSRHDW